MALYSHFSSFNLHCIAGTIFKKCDLFCFNLGGRGQLWWIPWKTYFKTNVDPSVEPELGIWWRSTLWTAIHTWYFGHFNSGKTSEKKLLPRFRNISPKLSHRLLKNILLCTERNPKRQGLWPSGSSQFYSIPGFYLAAWLLCCLTQRQR